MVRGYQNIETEICGGGKRKLYIIVLAVNGNVDFGGKVDHTFKSIKIKAGKWMSLCSAHIRSSKQY